MTREQALHDALSDLHAVVRDYYSNDMGTRLAQAMRQANAVLMPSAGVNADILAALLAIDKAASNVEATEGPSDVRDLWTAIYAARAAIAKAIS